MTITHGGPDHLGVPHWDFSTNANACGPCPQALQAVQQADARRYPDPTYASLREALADFHGVDAVRIVLASSASEFIARITAWVAREGGERVWLPELAYGDYAAAASAWRMARSHAPERAQLAWACEPGSPLGGADPLAQQVLPRETVVVLDLAYEPLRLQGACSWRGAALDAVWQLWTPNKAMGLTGVRGAYAIAPLGSRSEVPELDRLAPSWPLGAHAVELLRAWVLPASQEWLAGSREQLRRWKVHQVGLLQELGWRCRDSDANYFCGTSARAIDPTALRTRGIKLRDAGSFGLPGHWRLSVQPPPAQAALHAALVAQMENAA